MFELVTFGSISLRSADGRQITELLRHPKQLALLAYLAVEARPATRDELIGLFWPDVAEQRARGSLSQALSSLRGIIGAGAIVTDGSMARHIALDIVRSDTAAFDAAFAAKRWSEAISLYRGEFLKGFLLPDTHEFEDWTSRIRERYRQAAVRALEARAEQLRAAGHALEAARTLGRACEITPERVDLAAATIEAFAAAGQPLAAVDWFTRYTRCFEKTFDEAPQPVLAARIDELRIAARRASAPAAPAHEVVEDEAVRSAPQPLDSVRDRSPSRATPRGPRRAHWSHVAILGALGVASALVGAIWLRVGDTAPIEPRGLTTMIIRIVNSTPDIGWPHVAESLEETLAARMSNPPRLYVAAWPGRTDHTPATRSPVGSAPQANREDVDFIVAGTIHQTAQRVRIGLRVSDGASHRTISSLRVSRPRRDVLSALDQAAEELADTLRPILGSAIASRMARTRTTSTAAWSDLEHSKALFADARSFAIRAASAQAAALLEIADSLARRATRADPDWIDAHLQLAHIDRARSFIRLSSATPDLSAASGHLASAADVLSDAASRWPDEVRVHELAGTVSYERWIVARPHDEPAHFLDEAVQFLERAILFDPYAARPWVTLSGVRAAQGDHAASAVAAQRALERDAFAEHTNELHSRLFNAYFELRQDEDAARWCDEINRRGPGRALGAFCELSLQGWSSIREPNLAVADSLVENVDAEPPAFAAIMRPRLRVLHAVVAARLGEGRTARRLLDAAVTAMRRTGDPEAASFHAAALIRLGELDAAQKLLGEWTRSSGNRILVQRWLHESAETDTL